MKRIIALTAAVLILGGCSGKELTKTPIAATSPTPTPVATTSAQLPEVTEEATAEPTEEPAQDTTTIGKSLTYKNGTIVRVVSAKVFSAGSYASGLVTGHKAVKVTWTLENKTGETMDVSGAQARLTYGADGTAAEPVYTDGVGGMYPFEGSLQNGKKKTAASAFSVPKAGLSKITVEVEPEYDSQTAFFTGAAK